jgi:anthranilate 1,2-dioxygenase small subunit
MMSPETLSMLAGELMADYAELIDSDRLEEWLELFTEDARYDVIPRENVEQGFRLSLMVCSNKAQLRDRITALRQANEYNLHYDRHLIGSVRVRPSPDGTFEIGANYAVFQTTLEGQSRLFSAGCYRDRVRMIDGRMRIYDKRVIVDTFSIPTLLATPL